MAKVEYAGQPVRTIIRATAVVSNWPDRYYDLTDMPWKEQQALQQELRDQGASVQQVVLEDAMPLLVAIEVRKRLTKEAPQ